MPARLSAFLIWAVAAAGVVFWALRLGVTPLAAPPGPTVSLDAAGSRADLSRLLGTAQASATAAPPAVAESSRFRLLGVIAAAPSQSGVALLVVDGRLPRALRVGAPIDGGLMLQSVTRRGVTIGPPGAPASVVLELPPLPAPATGEPLRLRPDGSVVDALRAPPPGMPPGAPPLALPAPALQPPAGEAASALQQRELPNDAPMPLPPGMTQAPAAR